MGLKAARIVKIKNALRTLNRGVSFFIKSPQLLIGGRGERFDKKSGEFRFLSQDDSVDKAFWSMGSNCS